MTTNNENSAEILNRIQETLMKHNVREFLTVYSKLSSTGVAKRFIAENLDSDFMNLKHDIDDYYRHLDIDCNMVSYSIEYRVLSDNKSLTVFQGDKCVEIYEHSRWDDTPFKWSLNKTREVILYEIGMIFQKYGVNRVLLSCYDFWQFGGIVDFIVVGDGDINYDALNEELFEYTWDEELYPHGGSYGTARGINSCRAQHLLDNECLKFREVYKDGVWKDTDWGDR